MAAPMRRPADDELTAAYLYGVEAGKGLRDRQAQIKADMPRWATLTLLQKLRDKGPAMKCVPIFAVKAMRHAASMIESHQQHDAELETAFEQSELEYQAEIARLQLTDAEREAIEVAIGLDDAGPMAATLRGLLDRVGPVRTAATETVEE